MACPVASITKMQHMLSKLTERFKYFFYELQKDWVIGVAMAPISSFVSEGAMPEVRWIDMPRDRLWADPFGVERGGRYYIFHEEMIYTRGIGTINCLVLDRNFQAIENKLVLSEDYHFSYPYLIYQDGVDYMLPETSGADKLTLYKCVGWPYEWRPEKVLLNTPCIDTVLFHHENYWWLIYTKKGERDGNEVYYIRRNTHMTDGWEACAEQRIDGGRYNSRSGGSVFEAGGRLYRVTQNCTDSYGQSVVINEIKDLTEGRYREVAVREVRDPSPDVYGFHTISAMGRVSLVDSRRERRYSKSAGRVVQTFLKKVKG